MAKLFGVDFPAVIGATFAGQLEAGTLHKITTTTDAYGQAVRTPSDIPIEVAVSKWKEETLVKRGWPMKATKVIMIAAGKPQPAEGDEVTVRDVAYRVLGVMDGGAEAVWNIAAVAK